MDSPIYAFIEGNDALETFTNLSSDTIEDIWHVVDMHMRRYRHRGPIPKTSTLDHLILYLMWMKSAQPYSQIAAVFDINETLVEDALNRVRVPLLETLESRWWAPRVRPQFNDGSVAPTAAIIIDGHTTQIGQPKLPYSEAKVYFDGKNWIYGYKSEVAVSTAAPHYCLFTSPHYPGSAHDYEIHKKEFRTYAEYLQMTPEEAVQCGLGHGVHYWKIMADKGYIGNPNDTHPLERVCPHKGRLTEPQRAWNGLFARERVVVEQYLGRLSRLWEVLNTTWTYDEEHFDTDFSIACMLTNEHIRQFDLEEGDRQFHIHRNYAWRIAHDAKIQARRDQTVRSRERRAQRLRQMFRLPERD
jgi:hypothetical protein